MPPHVARRLCLGLLLAVLAGACNPFAPALDDGEVTTELGDPRTVEGFFTRFRAAYELRDAALYEPLLDSAFTFVYYDDRAQVERRWGYADDLQITRRLFAGASDIRLRWRTVLTQQEAPTEARIVRGFDLTVTLAEDGSEVRTNGNVNFTLVRRDTSQTWRLLRWRDESEL